VDNRNAGWDDIERFFICERVLMEWYEKKGYEVDYAISSDLERHPELLKRYRLMLSVGHDEYWSWGMRDTVESFAAQGGNACFFSGNVAFWQIRHEDNGNTMVCYKEAPEEDPLFTTDRKHLTATLWSSPIVGRSETSLTGLSFLYGGIARWEGASPHGAGGYLVYRPEHWVFKDSGLVYADLLGQSSQIVHFEVDGCPVYPFLKRTTKGRRRWRSWGCARPRINRLVPRCWTRAKKYSPATRLGEPSPAITVTRSWVCLLPTALCSAPAPRIGPMASPGAIRRWNKSR
jgi:hypothetical protein